MGMDFIPGARPTCVSFRGPRSGRSEERRGGKEGRSRGEWSSDVCSSDLQGLGSGLVRNDMGWEWTSSRVLAPLVCHSEAHAVGDRKSGVEGKRGDLGVNGVQTCALPIFKASARGSFGMTWDGNGLHPGCSPHLCVIPRPTQWEIGRAAWRERGEISG